jgi:hypothetical protein
LRGPKEAIQPGQSLINIVGSHVFFVRKETPNAAVDYERQWMSLAVKKSCLFDRTEGRYVNDLTETVVAGRR